MPGKSKWCVLAHTAYKMSVAQLVKNLPATQETLVRFLEDLLPLIPGRSVGTICWRRDRLPTPVFLVFPGGSAGKESACNVGDPCSIPGLGRSAGEGIGYPLQYSWSSLVAQLLKESACNVGDLGLIPGLGRYPGEGKGYPIQYSGPENSMDPKSRTQLSDFHFTSL